MAGVVASFSAPALRAQKVSGSHKSAGCRRKRIEAAAQPTGGRDGGSAERAGANENQPSTRSRRTVLQLATAGSLYAWAGRSAQAADARAAEAAAAAAARGGGAAELLERQLAERLSEFSLPNGLRFLVYERRGAPIASFHIYADVGAFDEEDGQTGGGAALPWPAPICPQLLQLGRLQWRQSQPI